jgi:double-stranded uracil-DNA glycosylase
MSVLTDVLASNLKVVFCGTAVGERSPARGRYYAGPGNAFWRLLHNADFTPRQLSPEEDSSLPAYGLGLTDLVKNVAQSHDRGLTFDVQGLMAKVQEHQPHWIAFTSKKAGQAAARGLHLRSPGLGPMNWKLGGARVFVLPSPSGANHRHEYDGCPTRLEWWVELANLVGRSS